MAVVVQKKILSEGFAICTGVPVKGNCQGLKHICWNATYAFYRVHDPDFGNFIRIMWSDCGPGDGTDFALCSEEEFTEFFRVTMEKSRAGK